MKTLICLCYLLIFASILPAQPLKKEFLPGDIVFQNLDCGPLCDAIEAVTEGYQNYDFSHVGMIVRQNDSLFVVEAIGPYVKMTPLKDFLSRSIDLTNRPKVMAARLHPRYASLISKACKLAKKEVGKPYDDRFVENNDSLYCSELIFEVFKNANKGVELFHKMPMTYKQPFSDQYYEAWKTYFRELNTAIPEGKMGINPGLISRSENIIMYYQLGSWTD